MAIVDCGANELEVLETGVDDLIISDVWDFNVLGVLEADDEERESEDADDWDVILLETDDGVVVGARLETNEVVAEIWLLEEVRVVEIGALNAFSAVVWWLEFMVVELGWDGFPYHGSN